MKAKRIPSKHKPWAIVQHWLSSLDRERFAPRLAPEMEMPHCFVCGWSPDHRDLGWSATDWNKSGLSLERAHIIPDALGGPDEPANLIMLCVRCHERSPDWPDPSEMERWISEQPRRLGRIWDMQLKWGGALEKVAADFVVTKVEDGKFLRVLESKIELAGTHGAEFSPGTCEAIMRAVCLELFQPVQTSERPT